MNDSIKPDLTKPIARAGEQIYASIQRERSGIDSGKISPSVRVFAVAALSPGDQGDMVSAALLLLEMVLDYTSEKSQNDNKHLLKRIVKRFGVSKE